MPYLEAEYTCAVGTGAKATGLAMRRSPYTDINGLKRSAHDERRHTADDFVFSEKILS
jgi:hypothetical protein